MNVQKLNEILRNFDLIKHDFSSNTKNKNYFLSKMEIMNGDVATTHFVMQILFTVQKEKHLHTEYGLDFFKINCKLP